MKCEVKTQGSQEYSLDKLPDQKAGVVTRDAAGYGLSPGDLVIRVCPSRIWVPAKKTFLFLEEGRQVSTIFYRPLKAGETVTLTGED